MLTDWFSREPVAGLLLVAAAILIFAKAVTRRPEAGSSFQAWLRTLLHAAVGALLFVGLAGAFQFLLNRGAATFNSLYGSFVTDESLPNQDWKDWKSRYGGPITQTDLIVHAVTHRVIREALPTAAPLGRTLYQNVVLDEPVTENIITAFEGRLEMELVHPEHPTDEFNAFFLKADYHYQVVNPIQTVIFVEFAFPLPDARLSRDIRVLVDGREPEWLVEAGSLIWEERLEPGQNLQVDIHYAVLGMDFFVFQIPAPRQIIDFSLSLAVNSVPSGLIAEPEGALSMEMSDHGAGKLVTWEVENSIAAPRIGTYMTQGWPYSPSHALLVVLPYAARGLLYFLAMTAFTLLIVGAPIELRQLALLAALFCVPFLILMAGLPVPGLVSRQNQALFLVGMLPVLTLIPVGLGYWTLRAVPALGRGLIIVLMVLFLCLFPRIGLLPDEQQRNAILGGVQAAMIFHIFALTLFVRLRRVHHA